MVSDKDRQTGLKVVVGMESGGLAGCMRLEAVSCCCERGGGETTLGAREVR